MLHVLFPFCTRITAIRMWTVAATGYTEESKPNAIVCIAKGHPPVRFWIAHMSLPSRDLSGEYGSDERFMTKAFDTLYGGSSFNGL